MNMSQLMKKSVFQKVAVITLLSTTVLSTFPARSHAIVGSMSAGIGLLVLGVGAGTGEMLIGYDPFDMAYEKPIYNLFFALSDSMALLGLVLLDDKGQVSPQFTALNSESAAKLGISSSEMSAYNAQLPEINSIYQSIVSDTEARNQKATTTQQLVAFSNQEWSEYGEELSPDALSALSKVRSNLSSQINQKLASR
jgi:hypothetical protein